MKKSIFILFLSALFVFSGCAKKESELTKIKLNEVVHSIFYAPQYVAIEKGFFKEQGLEIELAVGQGADKSMTALISGDADIALLGTEAGIYVYNQGKEDHSMIFAQLTQCAGNFLVSRENEDDFKWDNVKGKEVIGGRIGGMPQMVFEYVLKKNNITIGTDVEMITNLQFESTAGAFAGGVGDYTAEFDPSALSLEKAGKGYVVASLGLESGRVPYTVYMATKEYIKKNPTTVQKFTDTIYQSQIWVREHSSQEIAEVILPHFPDSDLESLEIMVERYKKQESWKDTPQLDDESFTRLQDIIESGGELTARVPFDAIIDNSFADTAVSKNK